MATLEPESEARLFDAAERAGRFFMEDSPLHRALRRLARTLDEERIPYAIVGAMALNQLGYERVTKDIDVLLTAEGLAQFKKAHLGRGYVEKFAGSKGLRDTESSITIDVLITGEFPGDGQPKPIAFPDPATAIRGRLSSMLPLERLLELKLASGMTAPHRLRDLADVLEVIRIRSLPEDLALHPYVMDKYRELWRAAQFGKDDE